LTRAVAVVGMTLSARPPVTTVTAEVVRTMGAVVGSDARVCVNTDPNSHRLDTIVRRARPKPAPGHRDKLIGHGAGRQTENTCLHGQELHAA
jgi:hypothetical protein